MSAMTSHNLTACSKDISLEKKIIKQKHRSLRASFPTCADNLIKIGSQIFPYVANNRQKNNDGSRIKFFVGAGNKAISWTPRLFTKISISGRHGYPFTNMN